MRKMTYVLIFLAIIVLGLFKCFSGYQKGGFQIEGKKVMYYDYNSTTWKRSGKEVKGVDFKTFEILKAEGNPFARDKNYFYLHGKIHPKIDHATGKYLGRNYFIDKDQVLHYGTQLKGANPKRFRMLDHGYVHDDERVYHASRLMHNCDPATFEVIDELYARDKNTLYLDWQVVKGANPTGFKYLNDKSYIFITDGRNVFHRTKMLNGADLASWEYIDYNYSKDKNHVYYSERKVAGANPSTFVYKRGEGFDAEDGKNQYKVGKRVN